MKSFVYTVSSLNYEGNEIMFVVDPSGEYKMSSIQMGRIYTEDPEEDLPLLFSCLVVFLSEEIVSGPIQSLDLEERDKEQFQDMYNLILDCISKQYLDFSDLCLI